MRNKMDFSATGNLLPGSILRPDIVTLSFTPFKFGGTTSKLCKLNKLGYIPVVSTVTGLGRALLGLVHTIVHLACLIFSCLPNFSKNRDHHLEEVILGAKNVGRGFIESIPVFGNITMLIVDLLRMNKFDKMAKDQFDKNNSAYTGQVTLFIYGQEIAKRPISEFYSELSKLPSKPTLEDIIKIYRNRNKD